MFEVLALKYRPTKFEDMVGQSVNAIVLQKMVETEQVPQGLLFAGPKGSGKTSAARIIASELEVPDPVEVDAASHGLVADVRSMVEALRYTTSGKYRVIILDEAHSMSKEAFNALLKTLEEPPANTIFILVTTEPDKIPETVKSRLMEFTFRKITQAEIFDRLTLVQSREGILADTSLIKHISNRADGSMRDALMLLDQCWKAEITDVPDFTKMVGEEDIAVELITALVSGDHQALFEAVDDMSQRVPDPSKLASALVQALKDLLILKVAKDDGNERSAKLRAVAVHLEPDRIVAAMKLLWDLLTRVRQANDPRSNLDLALVLISDIFTQGRQKVAPPQPKPERKLTMAEL